MSTCINRSSHFMVTDVSSEEFEFTWQINNFKLLHPGADERLTAEGIVNMRSVWIIHLYADGVDGAKEYLAASVRFERKLLQIIYPPYKFLVCLIDKHGKEVEVYTSTDVKEPMFIQKLIRKDYVIDEKNEFLTNGSLIIKFKLFFTSEIVCKPKSTCLTAPPANQPKLNSLECLFNKEKFSDVRIVVGGKKVLYAYKGILASQSPVFAAMFQHDMKENQQSVVKIADIDYEVMEELLRFIYLGKVNKIEIKALKLLIAADKYELGQLKIMCEESMINNDINVNTVVNVFIVAEKYGAKKLKEYAKQFFNINSTEVIQTRDYKTASLNVIFSLNSWK